ncbi:hypothetical protein VTN00DRAFT_2575 [Thermoascus crustaceus]|uniref:uncharacterized protein n=1 Tax=Thermoascus crustaceus TaxID=5088 RepID=UPI003743786D
MTEMYSGLHVGQRFDSLEEFKTNIRSISVRQHWDLRVVRSNKKSVVLGCRSSPNCYFRVVCRANKNATYITSLQDSHSCRRNPASPRSTPARSEASHVRFLLSEIPKLFDMKNKIRGQEVVDAVKRYHGYDISMRQAQRALTKLQPRRPRVHPDQAPDSDGNAPEQQQTVQNQPPRQGNVGTGINNNLAGNNWIQNQLLPALIEGGNVHRNEAQRNQAVPQPQSRTQQVQSHGQGQPREQRPPPNHHLPPINIPQQAFPRPPQAQPPAARPGPKPQRQQQQQQPQPQPLQQAGHPAAAQLVLTNFKIEFTCTTCGALNQSFFPNHGNVTAGSYIPPHPPPNPSSAHTQTTATSVRAEGNSNTNDDDDDADDEYEGSVAGHRASIQSQWTQGGLDVPLNPPNA